MAEASNGPNEPRATVPGSHPTVCRVGSIRMLYGRSNGPPHCTNSPESVTAANGSSVRSSGPMAQDINNGSIRIDYEEATNAPWLVSQRIDDLEAALDGTFMHVIDVCDLHAHMRQEG